MALLTCVSWDNKRTWWKTCALIKGTSRITLRTIATRWNYLETWGLFLTWRERPWLRVAMASSATKTLRPKASTDSSSEIEQLLAHPQVCRASKIQSINRNLHTEASNSQDFRYEIKHISSCFLAVLSDIFSFPSQPSSLQHLLEITT